MDKDKTAVIYLRVSTAAQVNKAIDPEGYSIPAQREACELHAERLGAEIAGEYVEPGRSATTMNRPALQRLLADLPGKRPTYVIVYDLSRIARDEHDAFWLLREITGVGAKLESTQEKIDDTPVGYLMYSILSGYNAFRSRNDGAKVKEGLRRKFLAGGAAGPARIGYKNARRHVGGREVAVIEVDDDRADLVRLAFDLYATGNFTLSTLTDVLAESGLRTRETPKRPSKPMSRASVHRMLGDDFYVGTVTHNGTKLRGLHDALIDETTFERVQNVLAAHKQSGDRSHKHEHYLTGEVFRCNDCEKRLGYGRHRGRGGVYEYFSCLSRVHRGGRCGAPYLRVGEVEEAVVRYHHTITYTAEEQELLRDEIRRFATPRVDAAKKQAAIHERRLRELKAEQQKLVQLSFKELIDDEVLAAEQERISAERAQARKWNEAAVHEVREIMSALDDALALVDKTVPYAVSEPTERRLINQATHVVLAPYLEIDGDGARTIAIRGVRDPFYVEADLIVGKTPPELVNRANSDPEPGRPTLAPISRSQGSDESRLAEREGFEPSDEGKPRHTISSRARSAAPAPLRAGHSVHAR